jgi:Fe-S-cluster-containing hydrogenase component 2
MENLPLTQAEVEAALGRIPGLDMAILRPFYKSLSSNFFKVGYASSAGSEIIMPSGVRSDFAALLLQGRVRVEEGQARSPRPRSTPEACWNQPGLLGLQLERWVLDRTDLQDASGDARPSWWNRIEGSLARKLRGWWPRLEDWAAGEDRKPGWVARSAFGWARRRASERSLANPPAIDPAGGTTAGRVLAEITARDEAGNEREVMPRFMGLTGALWNVPRSVTLVAQSDGPGLPCTLLLIKRDVLLKIDEKSESFHQQTTKHFLDTELALLLCENRLFRNTLAEDEIIDWPGLLARLRGQGESGRTKAVQRIRQRLLTDFDELARWIEEPPARSSPGAEPRPDGHGPSGDDPRAGGDEARANLDHRNRYQILSALNTLLKSGDLDSPEAWPEPGPDVQALRNQPRRSENETIRLNRLLMAQAFEGVLRPAEPPGTEGWPLRVEQFQELIEAIRAPESGGRIALRHYAKDERIYEHGEPATELYLIVSGTVRVTTPAAGGEVLVNQLERHGYFGVTAIEDDVRHSATVRAVTEVNAVALDRGAVRLLAARYPAVGRKLRGERARFQRRDALMTTLARLPPTEPPEEIASQLMVAGNLLRIDMDRCVRCDQCVRACAEAHDGVSRFVRANPRLRFGRWEVAAACVHCRDAPCQSACPVGAITFVDDGTVHIHRSRCIGCEKCVPACPFDVIAMERPPTERDIATNTVSGLVATKCDLCLDEHGDPPCVVSCPYGAAERGTPRALFPGIKSWAEVRSSH